MSQYDLFPSFFPRPIPPYLQARDTLWRAYIGSTTLTLLGIDPRSPVVIAPPAASNNHLAESEQHEDGQRRAGGHVQAEAELVRAVDLAAVYDRLRLTAEAAAELGMPISSLRWPTTSGWPCSSRG